jgi:hypothetical protein
MNLMPIVRDKGAVFDPAKRYGQDKALFWFALGFGQSRLSLPFSYEFASIRIE